MSNFSDMEGVERATEAALVLSEGDMSEEEIFAGLKRLVFRCSSETEVWILANRVLGAVSPVDGARDAYLELCDHVCPFHGHDFPLVALGWKWKVVERGISLPSDLVCRWRIVPDEVALALARFGSRQAIQVAADTVRFVDGKRTAKGSWPVLASSLTTVVQQVD